MKVTFKHLENLDTFVMFVDGQPFCTRKTLIELVVIADKLYKMGPVKCWN